MNYKIINGKLLLNKDGVLTPSDGILWVKDGILSLSAPADENGYETVDASGMLIMPGLINMHTHAYMTSMRNYADDVDFSEWLFKRIEPVENRLPAEGAYWTNLLAFEEMIRTGTTCFVDMHMFPRQSPLAALKAGIRGYIGRGLVGDDLYEDGRGRFEQAIDEMKEFECDTLHFVLSPHAIYSAGEKLYRQVDEYAKEHNMLKQTHLSESVFEVESCIEKHGKTPVEYLRDIGFLDEKTILAHCVQMRGDDISILKAAGANVVTNPASNAKLGNGFAPVSEMLAEGINLCIGTDGTASNNTLNMIREMNILSLFHKAVNHDPTSVPSQEIVKAATCNAAAALGMKNRLGTIADGADADIIFVDLNSVSLFPNNNIVSSLCYSANGSEISSVMINGRFVMKNHEILSIDSEQVRFEVKKIVDAYL